MITATLVDSGGITLSAQYDHENPGDGDTWLTKLEGWSGGVSVKGDQLSRATHGDFALRNYRTRRTITLAFVAERDSREELWALERGISGLFSDGGFGTLEVKQDEDSLSCEVELDGEPKIDVQLDAGVIEVELPLSSPEPWLYAPWNRVQLAPKGVGIGLEYPLFSWGRMRAGANLIVDPDGLDPEVVAYRSGVSAGWSWNGVGGYWAGTAPSDGSAVLRLESSAAGLRGESPLTPGERLSMGVDVALDAGTVDVRYAIWVTYADGSTGYHGDGKETGGDPDQYSTVGAGGFERVVRTFDVPADTVSASFEVQVARATVDGAGVRVRGFDVHRTTPVLTFGAEVEEDVLVWNDGNANSYPIFTVYADTPGGFRVRMGDNTVAWPRATFKSTPIEIHMDGKVIVGGFDQSQFLTERDWAPIAPHTIETPKFELLQGGTGWCEVAFRDTNV